MEANFVYEPNWTTLKAIKLVVSLLMLLLCLAAIVVTLKTPLQALYLTGSTKKNALLPVSLKSLKKF